MAIGRRHAIGAVGAIGAGLLLGTAAPGAPATPKTARLDFADPADRLQAYMLMRGALDERLVIGCVSGSYFGVVDDSLTPLWDVVAATFARYRRRADGGYDGFTAEVAYFIDPRTRLAPGRFPNPYTGELVDEPRQGYAPSRIVIAPDLTIALGKPVPGLTMDVTIKQPRAQADDVWFPELTQTAITRPGAAKPFHYSESIIMHARRSDLEAIGVKKVRTEVSFTNVVSWRPWMKMGDRPGHMTAVGTGAFSDDIAILPDAWIAATRERRPELLANPGQLIDAIWNGGRQ